MSAGDASGGPVVWSPGKTASCVVALILGVTLSVTACAQGSSSVKPAKSSPQATATPTTKRTYFGPPHRLPRPTDFVSGHFTQTPSRLSSAASPTG